MVGGNTFDTTKLPCWKDTSAPVRQGYVITPAGRIAQIRPEHPESGPSKEEDAVWRKSLQVFAKTRYPFGYFRAVEGEFFDVIVWWSVLTNITKEGLIARPSGGCEDCTKESAGRADERFPRDELILSRCLTDDRQAAVCRLNAGEEVVNGVPLCRDY